MTIYSPGWTEHPIVIREKTLFDAYLKLNDEFLKETYIGQQEIQRGLGGLMRMGAEGITLIAEEGFGLNPGFIYHDIKRVPTLTKRYLEPSIWEAAVAGIKKVQDKDQIWVKGWKNFNFLLFRDPARSRVPFGGGCLMGFSLSFNRGRFFVDVFSRASEIGKALYGDLEFIEYLVNRIFLEAGIIPRHTFDHGAREHKGDGGGMWIRWNISVGYQRSLYVPQVVFWSEGYLGFKKWMKQKGRSEWEDLSRKYTKDVILNPGKIKIGSDLRWSKILAKAIMESDPRGKEYVDRFSTNGLSYFPTFERTRD